MGTNGFRSPRKQLPHDPDIRNNDYKRNLHQFFKHLGVFIGAVLPSNKQIDNTCSKLGKANGIISKLRHFFDKTLHFFLLFYLLFPPTLWWLGLIAFIPIYAIFGFYLLTFTLYLAFIPTCAMVAYSKQISIDRISKLRKHCIRILSFSDFSDHTNG